jgi:hypothetical protein
LVLGRGWLRATAATAAAALVGASPVILFGCSQPTARQDLPGTCAPFDVVSSTPSDGADDIPIDAPIRLDFTDFPNPETVSLGSIVLSSGIQTRLGSFKVDLLTRSIRLGTRNWLLPNLTYLVTLLPNLRSLTGCAVESQQRRFRTGAGPSDPPPPPPSNPPFSDVLPILAARCAGAACHRQPLEQGGGCLAAPTKGLSLCDRDAWSALVDADAVEVAGMKRVVAGDASRSYLLRKLIPGPTGGPVPTTPGHRDPPDAPLGESDLRLISDWIDAGAAN